MGLLDFVVHRGTMFTNDEIESSCIQTVIICEGSVYVPVDEVVKIVSSDASGEV